MEHKNLLSNADRPFDVNGSNVVPLRSSLEMTGLALNDLTDICHGESARAGWHDNPREDGTMLALIHSEISEALEGERKGLFDDHLPQRPMAEVELADAIIRICDYAGAKGYDLGGALVEKVLYNRERADHKRENRAKDGGKKF